MSVESLCEICGSGGITHTCDRCGQLVCDDHYDEDLGYCVECAAEVGKRRRVNDDEDLPDGVDTYRF